MYICVTITMIMIWDIFIIPKGSLVTVEISSLQPPHPQLLVTLDLSSLPIVLAFLECHPGGILYRSAFLR